LFYSRRREKREEERRREKKKKRREFSRNVLPEKRNNIPTNSSEKQKQNKT